MSAAPAISTPRLPPSLSTAFILFFESTASFSGSAASAAGRGHEVPGGRLRLDLFLKSMMRSSGSRASAAGQGLEVPGGRLR
eukprot:2956274-Heterocapsa_arctica.AAC.1